MNFKAKYLSTLFALLALTSCENRVYLEPGNLIGKYQNSYGQTLVVRDSAEVIFASDGQESLGLWQINGRSVTVTNCRNRYRLVGCERDFLGQSKFTTYKIKGKIVLRISDNVTDQFVKIEAANQ